MRDLSEKKMEIMYYFKEHTSSQPDKEPFNFLIRDIFSVFVEFGKGVIEIFIRLFSRFRYIALASHALLKKLSIIYFPKVIGD